MKKREKIKYARESFLNLHEGYSSMIRQAMLRSWAPSPAHHKQSPLQNKQAKNPKDPLSGSYFSPRDEQPLQ